MFLAALGGLGAFVGGSEVLKAAARVTFWGVLIPTMGEASWVVDGQR